MQASLPFALGLAPFGVFRPAVRPPTQSDFIHAIEMSRSNLRDPGKVATAPVELQRCLDIGQIGRWQIDVVTGVLWGNSTWWLNLEVELESVASDVTQWQSWVHPEDIDSVKSMLAACDNRDFFAIDLRLKARASGWLNATLSGYGSEFNCSGTATQLSGIQTIRHPTGLHDASRSQRSPNDALTGLPGRTALQTQLAAFAIERIDGACCELAVLVLDVDRFRMINDGLSCNHGNWLLRDIANRLRVACTTSMDAELGPVIPFCPIRIGGDKFAMGLYMVFTPDVAARFAAELGRALSLPYLIGTDPVHASFSIGVAMCQGGHGTPGDLIDRADLAMHESKRLGRGRTSIYAESMRDHARHVMSMDRDLRAALQTEKQLWIGHQPIVELGTRRIIGAEALARWDHPVKGAIPAMDFISAAEQTDLILEVGTWVLRQACKETAALLSELPDDFQWTVSVNLSRMQAMDKNLPAIVFDVLQDSGLPSHRLRLEITESLSIQDADVLGVLAQLRLLGVGMALDDFGVGYSSLASLDRLPIDTVKIDRSFIDRMASRPYQAAMVEAIVEVARSMGVHVVAEGVEDELQAATLNALGCKFAQGWLFGKAVPAMDLRSQLRKQVDGDRAHACLSPEADDGMAVG